MSKSFCLGLVGLALAALPASATILVTTNQSQVNNFSNGTDLEDFEGLTGTDITNYGAGQTILEASRFSSREPGRLPTFHSGGATPGDPVGNPGAPIGIVSPTGGIAGDVESGDNVAAPLVIFTDEPFNNGFLEVIFPEPVDKVGFWVTHGGVSLDLRDVNGSTLTTGDFEATASGGQFVGISRPTADIVVAALIVSGGGDAFSIDDFVSTEAPVPEPGAPLLLAAGALALAAVTKVRGQTRY
jgi:hypothetical protein